MACYLINGTLPVTKKKYLTLQYTNLCIQHTLSIPRVPVRQPLEV